MSREDPIEIDIDNDVKVENIAVVKSLRVVSTSTSSSSSDSSSSSSSSSDDDDDSSSSSSSSDDASSIEGTTSRHAVAVDPVARKKPSPSTESTTRSTTTTAAKPLRNPYLTTTSSSNTSKRRNSNTGTMTTSSSSFVGGAEATRQAARKKARTKILTPMERQRRDGVLPLRMSPLERFLAALLQSPATDYVQADASPDYAQTLWTTICGRVGLIPPTAPLPARVTRPQDYFGPRAALVLEEARHALSESLTNRQSASSSSDQQDSGRRPSSVTMNLTVQSIQGNPSNGHTRVVLLKKAPFTRDELYLLRTGTVVACCQSSSSSKTNDTISNVHLAVLLSGSRDQIQAKRCFQVTFFLPLQNVTPDTQLTVRPLETLVSQQRAFSAMTVQPHKLPFLQQWLGQPGAVYTRFDEDGNIESSGSSGMMSTRAIAEFFRRVDAQEAAGTSAASKTGDSHSSRATSSSSSSSSLFQLGPLNKAQERAATTFLKSPPHTLTLVQGPPGCGKTTLLVNVIARYLLNDTDNTKRLMVCAPTNKAVAVLAARFAESYDEARAPFAALLVGDADKLLGDDTSNTSNPAIGSSPNSKLAGMLSYTWLPTLVQDYQHMLKFFRRGASRPALTTLRRLAQTAVRLEKRLENGLYGLGAADIFDLAGKITHGLNMLQADKDYDVAPLLHKLVTKLDHLHTTQPEAIWRLLLSNANVIFCTCAAAGGSLFKSTAAIDDLVIDEAAAATEPELCIPFHLTPQRMLCVGDPRQLPATVLSRRALQLGLDQSLHERLMDHCGFDHIMLDVQYRMTQEISAFPSMQFYASKLHNGTNVQDVAYRKPPFVLDGRPYIFLQTRGREEKTRGGSTRNLTEANTIVQLVEQFRDRAMTCDNDEPWFSMGRIRIITFYQGQVALIKKVLRQRGFGDKVIVATVDSSQGCEADVVLVSFVRSPRTKGANARQAAGFLTDDRRINVALTRAKYQLVCVGNVRGLSEVAGADTINKLARDALRRKVVRSLLDDNRS